MRDWMAWLLTRRHTAQLPGVVGECWEFTGARYESGHGHVRKDGRDVRVHRLMADLVDLPGAGPVVRHTCDNPPCFNPPHLVRGTKRDNTQDALVRGRLNTAAGQRAAVAAKRAQTHCKNGHQLDERRRCLVCRRASKAASRARQRQ